MCEEGRDFWGDHVAQAFLVRSTLRNAMKPCVQSRLGRRASRSLCRRGAVTTDGEDELTDELRLMHNQILMSRTSSKQDFDDTDRTKSSHLAAQIRKMASHLSEA